MFDEISRSIDEFGNSLLGALNNVQNAFGRELSVAKPIKENVLQMIGNTPLIRLNQIGSHIPNVEIYLKAEFCNPTGSVKDRTALSMVLAAERRGELKAGGSIFQAGYNTTAISLAWISTLRQYKFKVFLAPDTDQEKIKELKSYGASVEVVQLAKGNWDDSLLETAKAAKDKEKNSVILNEFKDMANTNAHFLFTGPEIWRDLAGNVDAFVAGGGSGGTLSGVGRYLKSKKPSLRVIMGVSKNSRFIRKMIQGDSSIRLPESFDPKVTDQYIGVDRDEALRYQSELYQKEGIFAGLTTGTTLASAIHYAESLPTREDQKTPSYKIVVLSPDRL
ncbi:PLP-dependent cysteine synthase family protein [Leptospira licerasiae]|uniref:Pyridoxal-phosphate dependent protein n=1 Tax=Leptospira licerasiae str. MMD4847 TaxID=1049971 RepID=A0ABN0HD77_9LEPT|nr:PLP-dependent cysteine synthase family protein [Leptospira licerasiae]EIE01602.1 pyridoxal-phosphate dependent protein [Leptospira licerasiae serovar Varillal str. VAR 010]EJZ43490.1 pyridoxal-phosphate dependent protein [Leptospira licerasiae str. MMD4847]TGM86505.1 PLP-dependent cysteine synthase family protein [Leptospira licerasiae]